MFGGEERKGDREGDEEVGSGKVLPVGGDKVADGAAAAFDKGSGGGVSGVGEGESAGAQEEC